MAGAAPRVREHADRTADTQVNAWVVSPHLLVGQAVTAALRAAGAPVEFHAWESVVPEAQARPETIRGRYVVGIFDGLDTPEVVDDIGRLVALGDVRVAVVTSSSSAFWWGGLVQGGAVDVVTVATSVGTLTDLVDRFVSGDSLMDPEGRAELRAAWREALDRRRHLDSLIKTLSPQQRRVLEMLAAGRRVREVAVVLGVADGTVRSHVKSMRSKLGVRTQLEAVAMFRQVHEVDGAADIVPRPRQG